jgi:seryl-tRNA synthetase
MLDIKFIRENKDIVKSAAEKKRVKVDVDKLITLDEERRRLISEVDVLRMKHKESSEKIKTLSGEEKEQMIVKSKKDKEELTSQESKLKTVEDSYRVLMFQIPNIPDLSVPEGESDEDNQEIRKWGNPQPQGTGFDYLSLMKNLDMLDIERGAKVSGFRGYFLKNDAVRLSMAFWQIALELMVEKGFQLISAPSMVKRESLIGTGWIGGGQDEDVFKTQDDLYLSGTAEVPMMAYHGNEILGLNELPKKYSAFSPCFRREIGTYGKDTKGIVRVHEFFKVEQVVLCESNHEESVRWHEELTKNAETLVQALNIPYRVVLNCGADLGLGQVKKYDIEGWIPSENKYRETHSASYFHDFQTRRLNIKYRAEDGKLYFAHSLNNTLVATPRILVAFLENNQLGDGSIAIPEALVKHFGTEVIKAKE